MLAASLLLGACTSSPDVAGSGPAKRSAGTGVETSPLTGEPLPDGRPAHPVYAVTIENTKASAPQHGLDSADRVVEQLVEGGISRLAALYDAALPTRIGHVRSLRATDAGIAAPVGARVVASGGAPGASRGCVRVSTEDDGDLGFSDDPAKSAPYDRPVDLRRLAKGVGPATIPGPSPRWAATSDASAAPAPKPVPGRRCGSRRCPPPSGPCAPATGCARTVMLRRSSGRTRSSSCSPL